MSLAEIATANATRQDAVLRGNLFCNAVIAQNNTLGAGILVQDQVTGATEWQYVIDAGEEQLSFTSAWAAWNPAYSYATGSIVRSGGVTYGRTGAASAPGAAPPGAGWTALAAPSPLSGTTVTALSSAATPAGDYTVFLQSSPNGNGLALETDAAGVSSATFLGRVVAPSVSVLATGGRIGSGTLVAGVDAIALASIVATDKVFVSRTGAPTGAGTGVLQAEVTVGVGFTVRAINAAGAVEAADVGNFDWWVVSTV
jgi:hypothetical protein